MPNPSAFVAHAREVIARGRTDRVEFDRLACFAVNHLAALCDVIEAATAYLAEMDETDHTDDEDALTAALARLEVPE